MVVDHEPDDETYQREDQEAGKDPLAMPRVVLCQWILEVCRDRCLALRHLVTLSSDADVSIKDPQSCFLRRYYPDQVQRIVDLSIKPLSRKPSSPEPHRSLIETATRQRLAANQVVAKDRSAKGMIHRLSGANWS